MSKKTINRGQLATYLETELQVARVRDYCPNGLQVEGRNEIGRIITGVTASIALLEAAIQLQADAVMVHHGYFWRGEDMLDNLLQCNLNLDLDIRRLHQWL